MKTIVTKLILPPSGEGHGHSIEELVITEDWDTRLAVNIAGLNALGSEIEATDDLPRTLELLEMYDDAATHAIAVGIINYLKWDIIAERQEFKDQFGEE